DCRGDGAPARFFDLDPVDQGVILDGDELDDDAAARVGGGGAFGHHRLQLAAGRREDVEAGQHLRAIDDDVEQALVGRVEAVLGEVQPDPVLGAGGEVL